MVRIPVVIAINQYWATSPKTSKLQDPHIRTSHIFQKMSSRELRMTSVPLAGDCGPPRRVGGWKKQIFRPSLPPACEEPD